MSSRTVDSNVVNTTAWLWCVDGGALDGTAVNGDVGSSKAVGAAVTTTAMVPAMATAMPMADGDSNNDAKCNSVSNECYNSGLEGVDDVEVMVLR